jgi:hypothetical protein
MKKLLSLTLATTLLSATVALAQHPRHPNANGPAPIHNGLWWKDKSDLYREAFIGGYKAGAKHVAGHSLDVNEFPATELIKGLNHFYTDFRNDNIYVDDALPYIAEELRGVSDDQLKAEILKLRAAAAPPPSSEE